MPYRRLPNTDKARLRALAAAYNKGKTMVPIRLPFPVATLNKTDRAYKAFLQLMEAKKDSYKKRVSVNKKFLDQQQKIKLYISHFIQVLNMCIQREEMPKSDRSYFGLEEDNQTVPEIQNVNDILNWGEIIIKGDDKRVLKGGNRIYNPKPAVLKIEFLKFKELYEKKLLANNIHEENTEKIKNMRSDIDTLIAEIWNKTEEFFKSSDLYSARKRCEAFGVVYVNRKKENIIKGML
jgi:hypothetical protein